MTRYEWFLLGGVVMFILLGAISIKYPFETAIGFLVAMGVGVWIGERSFRRGEV